MIKELLKIIFSADTMISQHSMSDPKDNHPLMVSCFKELKEIDEKIRQHFQEEL